LSPGDAFIDVGANAGFYCAHVAKVVGAQGLVLGVEPNPAMVTRLQEVARENSLDNLEVINAAASDFQGDAVLLVGSDHGLTRLDPTGSQVYGINVTNSEKVAVISLDSLAERLGKRKLRGIKLDIEGHEYRALLGAKDLLSKFRPLVQMEFNPALMMQYGITTTDLGRFFEGLNYLCLIPTPPRGLCFHKSAVTLARCLPGSEQLSGSDLWACPIESESALLNAWQSAAP
jgi:FkbM family methyltransferase